MRLARLLAERWAGQNCAAVISCSTSDRDATKRLGIAQAPRLRLVPNGLGDTTDSPRKSGATGHGTPELVNVGHLVRAKGQEDLIAAMPLVLARHPQLHLGLVGEGPLRSRLARYARAIGVESRVEFLGLRTDAQTISAQCRVYVSSSHWEGMPYAVMEAMAAGRAIVATAVGGCTDLIRHGQDGVLVPASSPGLLARAVLSLLADPERAGRLGCSARERVHRQFGLSQCVESMLGLYHQAARGRPLFPSSGEGACSDGG